MLHSNYFNYTLFGTLPGDKLDISLPESIPSLFTFLKENDQPLVDTLQALGILRSPIVPEVITDTGQHSSRYVTFFKTNFTPTLATVKTEAQTIGYL